jgi:pimeloyl-ACP methyl ester carboxylesterase
MKQAPHFRRSGSGEAFVLVHGYFGGSAQWAREIEDLGFQFDVVAVDLPGFGDSHTMPAPQTIEGFARSVLELLDTLGIKTFRLLGHSMGGMIVQDMCRLAQQRVTQLFLYATGPIGLIPGRFETMQESRHRLKTDGVLATSRRISAKWFIRGDADPAHALCARLGAQASEDAALAGLNAMESWDGRHHLRNLRVPTQLIWGEKDKSYHFEQMEMLWRGIPECSLAVIPHASHAAHLEQPAVFREVLRASLLAQSSLP